VYGSGSRDAVIAALQAELYRGCKCIFSKCRCCMKVYFASSSVSMRLTSQVVAGVPTEDAAKAGKAARQAELRRVMQVCVVC
jgi:hypothetical protein